MVRQTNARGLTADAFALSRALATFKVKLSHQQCLGVVAKMQGHKSYEAMPGVGNALATTSAHEERMKTAYGAMRARLDHWWHQGRVPGGAPAQLMAEAYNAGIELRQTITEAISGAGLEGVYPLYLTMVQNGTVLTVHAVRADETGYCPVNAGREPWRLIEVHYRVEPLGDESAEQVINEATLGLYTKYLETVEVVAKGYGACMEMFDTDVQYLGEGERNKSLLWRFYEADESTRESAAKHPMVKSGEYFICSTEPVCAGVAQSTADMAVGLWHVHESALTGKMRWESMGEDVQGVLQSARPLRISLGHGSTEAFNWVYTAKVRSKGPNWAIPELLEAVVRATDGAELMMAAGIHGWVRIEGGRVHEGLVVVDATDTHKRRPGSKVLEQDEVDRLAPVIRSGIARGLLRVAGVIEPSGRIVTVVPSSLEAGYASRMMLR